MAHCTGFFFSLFFFLHNACFWFNSQQKSAISSKYVVILYKFVDTAKCVDELPDFMPGVGKET